MEYGTLIVRTPWWQAWLGLLPGKVRVKFTAIRRGGKFRTMRFPKRTAQQFMKNEAFINSAYER